MDPDNLLIRFRIQDTRYWVLGAWYLVLGTGYKSEDACCDYKQNYKS